MEHKSLHVDIPKIKPFDKDNWFESFVGNFIIPILDTGFINKYWFIGYNNDATFRFYTQHFNKLESHIENLVNQLGLNNLKYDDGYTPYGNFSVSRFLGNNQRQKDGSKRTDLIYNFLFYTSQLYVDMLSYKDADNYWYLEENTDRGNNHHGNTLESIHHLFCTITCVPTTVQLIEKNNNKRIVSPFYQKVRYKDWNIINIIDIKF